MRLSSFLAASKAGQRNQAASPTTTATDTFMKLKCNFNICATDISTATAASTSFKGIHLSHPRNSDACKPGHPTHSAEPSGNQRTAAPPSRPLTFTLTPMKHFNPPSVASATGKESHHHISGLSSFFRNLQSVMSCQQIDTPQLFLPAGMQPPAASSPTTTMAQQEHQQPPVQSQPPLQSADAKQQ